MRIAKPKALISFAVTAKLICVFVFAYAKSRFSHNEALMTLAFFRGTVKTDQTGVTWFCQMVGFVTTSIKRKPAFCISENKSADQ